MDKQMEVYAYMEFMQKTPPINVINVMLGDYSHINYKGRLN